MLFQGKILRPVGLLPDKAERLYTPTRDIQDATQHPVGKLP
jgi:hypothetical protein